MIYASSLQSTPFLVIFILTSIPVAAGEKDRFSKPDASPSSTEPSLFCVPDAAISGWLHTLRTEIIPIESASGAEQDLPSSIAAPQSPTLAPKREDTDSKSESDQLDTPFSDILMECPGCSTHNLCDPFAKLCAAAQQAMLARVSRELLDIRKMPIGPVCPLVNVGTKTRTGYLGMLRYSTRIMNTSPIFIEYRDDDRRTPVLKVYQVNNGLITPPTTLSFPSVTLEQIRKRLDEGSKKVRDGLLPSPIPTHDHRGAATNAATLYMQAQLTKCQAAWQDLRDTGVITDSMY